MNADNNKRLLPIGTLLHNNVYRVERHLASGGFGNTYLVTNVEFNEKVAIKEFFLKGISAREGDTLTVMTTTDEGREQFDTQREKFKKEARLLRKIDHKNIVRVHDLFDENGTSYYAMDWIDGESLTNLLKRKEKPLTEKETLAILDQLLDALETIHERGIWHLDLKPANIMLSRQGKVTLIDFGASKQFSSVEGYTSLSGFLPYTPGYAASEQMEGTLSNLGPWTDFFALGATLYYLLTCSAPPSLSDLSDESFVLPNTVSKKMQDLIAWMMTPARRRRPQSVAQIRSFLTPEKVEDRKKEETIQQVPPVTPPRPMKPEPNKSLSWRKYGTWLLYAFVLAAAIGCGVFCMQKCGNSHGGGVTGTDSIPDRVSSVKVVKEEKMDTPAIVKPTPKPVPKPIPKPTGPLDLGYATWDGPVQNGKPAGYGTMRYKSSHLIGGNCEGTASVGDVVVGDFTEGYPSSGTWRKSSGEEVSF